MKTRLTWVVFFLVAGFSAGCAHRPLELRATQVLESAAVAETTAAEDAEERVLRETARLLGYREDGAGVETTWRLGTLKSLAGASERKPGGLDLFVLGGLFIPGQLSIDELTFSEQAREGGVVTMKAETRSKYVAVPPVCQSAVARLEVKDGVATLQFENFYCNWMAVGNVIVGIEFRLGVVAPETGSVRGTYTVRVNGTANGAGRGFFEMTRAE